MKKLTLILVLLLTVVLVGCPGGVFGNNYVRQDSYENSENYKIGNQTYDLSNVTKVEIDWATGSIEVKQSDTSNCTIAETSDELEDNMKVHSIIENNTLKIEFWESGLYAKVESNKKRLTVTIPANLDLEVQTTDASISVDTLSFSDVTLETISGNIDLDELTSQTDVNLETTSGKTNAKVVQASDIDIDTVSGDIKINTLNATGDIDIETTSATLEVEKVDGRNVNVDTNSGRVEIESIKVVNKIEIDTSAGNVEVLNVSATSVDIKTISGAVTLSLVEYNATIEYKTVSGQFKTSLENEIVNNRYVFGQGTTVVNVSTTSGNLTVK